MVEHRSPKPSMRVQLLLPLPFKKQKPNSAFFVAYEIISYSQSSKEEVL